MQLHKESLNYSVEVKLFYKFQLIESTVDTLGTKDTNIGVRERGVGLFGGGGGEVCYIASRLKVIPEKSILLNCSINQFLMLIMIY